MVSDDVDRSSGQSNFNKSNDVSASAFIASPVDRLAAFMADLVLFLPLVTLVLAPLKKEALLAQIAEDHQQLLLIGMGGAAIACALLIAYQTFFIGAFGVTPGKRFLGLRVINIWDKQRPTYFAAFIRSVFWIFSLCSLGIPWLAIFSNSHRRPMHDRVADTLTVVNDQSRAAASPGLVERSMINGLNAAVITFSILLGSVFVQAYVYENKDIAEVIAIETTSSSQRCEQVTSAVGEWLGTEEHAPNRMEIALALHAGERIEDDCLDAEATTNFLEEKYLELSYLAKALLKREDEEQFSDYMDKVCESEQQTAQCELLEAVQASGDKPVALPAANAESSPTYFRIWAVKLNLERGFAAQALALLDTPAPHMDLAYYFATKRLQAKLDLKYETDIRSDFLASIDGLNREERISFARETCLAQTQLSCDQHFSCGKLLEFTSAFKAERELSFENPSTVLAIARAVRCEDQPELYKKFLAQVEIAPGRDLIEASKLMAEGKTKSATKLLSSLAKQEDFVDIRAEAAALLLENANAKTDLETVSSDWSELEKTSVGWRYLGWQLHKAYLQRSDFARALEVGRQLKVAGINSTALQKNLVIAAYESDQVQEARDLLAELDQPKIEESDRAPASASKTQFEKIVELLDSTAVNDPSVGGL